MVLSRKIKLMVVGDKEEKNRVYSYIRDGAYNQNRAANQYISDLFIETIKQVSVDDRKELHRLYSRISTSKKGSAYDDSIEFAKGLPSASSMRIKIEQDFSNACKKGLLYGKISLPSYRLDSPLLVHSDYVSVRGKNKKNTGLYHNYSSHNEFLEHLYEKDLEVFIKFANDITFKLIFGNVHKSEYLRTEIKYIFEEYYSIGCSSIQILGKDIILNLALKIPDKKVELDEETVVGVHLGFDSPVMCACNKSKNFTKFGSPEDFIRIRTQLQEQRRRIQKNIAIGNKGGHGRKKKMQSMERLKNRERNFARTYNHQLSSKIIHYALDNNAKYINLEDFSKFRDADTFIDKNGKYTKKFMLRNWSYYELQQFIEYKAKRYGIEVRHVNMENIAELIVSEEDLDKQITQIVLSANDFV